MTGFHEYAFVKYFQNQSLKNINFISMFEFSISQLSTGTKNLQSKVIKLFIVDLK